MASATERQRRSAAGARRHIPVDGGGFEDQTASRLEIDVWLWAIARIRPYQNRPLQPTTAPAWSGAIVTCDSFEGRSSFMNE